MTGSFHIKYSVNLLQKELQLKSSDISQQKMLLGDKKLFGWISKLLKGKLEVLETEKYLKKISYLEKS